MSFSDLWLDWLADEIELADSTRARQKVADLFAVAVEDYLSPALWTLYCQFMAGAHSADPDVFDLPTIRAVFDKVSHAEKCVSCTGRASLTQASLCRQSRQAGSTTLVEEICGL